MGISDIKNENPIDEQIVERPTDGLVEQYNGYNALVPSEVLEIIGFMANPRGAAIIHDVIVGDFKNFCEPRRASEVAATLVTAKSVELPAQRLKMDGSKTIGMRIEFLTKAPDDLPVLDIETWGDQVLLKLTSKAPSLPATTCVLWGDLEGNQFKADPNNPLTKDHRDKLPEIFAYMKGLME